MNIYFYFKNALPSDSLEEIVKSRVKSRMERPCTNKHCWMHVMFEATKEGKAVCIEFFYGHSKPIIVRCNAWDFQSACDEALDEIFTRFIDKYDLSGANRIEKTIKLSSVKNSGTPMVCDGADWYAAGGFDGRVSD